jgi:hypothetical protein
MSHYFNELVLWVERMNTTHWVMVFVVAVLIGCWALRGFGSRASY